MEEVDSNPVEHEKEGPEAKPGATETEPTVVSTHSSPCKLVVGTLHVNGGLPILLDGISTSAPPPLHQIIIIKDEVFLDELKHMEGGKINNGAAEPELHERAKVVVTW